MPKGIRELKPIPPLPPRWEPSTDPSTIHIPGLDTTASVNDQIDQIDQLITLKLQDIDANFSKMQQVLSNRILPAFKRFAIGTEPVREAAKFWTSFYEHAAQVHIPTSDQPSFMQDPSTSSAAHDTTSTSEEDASAATPGPSSHAFNLNRTPSESSFLPAHAAVSSTPAARAQAAANSTFFTSQTPSAAADPSWSALVESPLVRLHRELHEFTRADPQPTMTSTEVTDSLLSTPTRTPARRGDPATTVYDEEYEEEPTLPAGMSPPVMLSFARLQTLGPSPAKSAATHIRHTLLRDALRDAGGSTASDSATAMTPPSFSRYTRGAGASASLSTDPELDSLMRRVSLRPSITTPESDDGSTTFSSSSSGEEDSMLHNTAHPSAAFLLASRQRGRHDDADNDDEDDSLEADPDAATASFEPVHPFARAVAAGAEDDSFDSLDGDAPEEETVFGGRYVKSGPARPLGT